MLVLCMRHHEGGRACTIRKLPHPRKPEKRMKTYTNAASITGRAEVGSGGGGPPPSEMEGLRIDSGGGGISSSNPVASSSRDGEFSGDASIPPTLR